MKIHILSDEMASRIAAGEVVERPASVVKELIENSLDAGATEISVSIEKSGTALICVTDNGEGMGSEDLALAVERHATSKLRNEEDLFRIATLGFRGEALPSIASVSRMEIVSRLPLSETGFRIRIEGGKKAAPLVTGSPPGTSVEIRDIFFNTPARRKFLKSPATELSHICDVFNRMALAHPEVHFRLSHEGRTIADHAVVNQLSDRFYQVLGREIAKDLIPFSWVRGDLLASGYLSSVPTSFPNSRYLITFVNRRFVRDKTLTHAVLQGYETLLMKGQYPAVVLFLDIPSAEVDVNVHPAKYEVKFRRQSIVHETVAEAIQQKLKEKAKEPSRNTFPTMSGPFAGVMEAQLPYRPCRRARKAPRDGCVSDFRRRTRGIDPQWIFLFFEYLGPDSWLLFGLFLSAGIGAYRSTCRPRAGFLRKVPATIDWGECSEAEPTHPAND